MSLNNFGIYFFNIFVSLINGFIGLFISPIITAINGLFSTFIVDYEYSIINLLSSINDIINGVILPGAVWVVNLFPPLTFSVCMLFLGLWLFLWSYELTAGVIIRILNLIKTTIPFV